MKDNRSDIEKRLPIGGQAVIEGVMMRGPGAIATAVRKENGTIVVRKDPFTSLTEKHRLLRLPILRGAVGLGEMLVIGMNTLNFSAEIALHQVSPAADDGVGRRVRIGATVALSVLAGLAIFFAGPLFLASRAFSVEQDPLSFNLIAGGIRIILFLGYLGGISAMRDVRRLFEYHGAEHKAVFAFEKGRALTVDAASEQSRFHPRCGTSFVLTVLLAAIVSFALLDALIISRFGAITLSTRLLSHLPLIPVVGGVAYEFIRASSRNPSALVWRALTAPGLWLQRLTTREPDAGQLEVALAALKAAVGEPEAGTPAAVPPLIQANAN